MTLDSATINSNQIKLIFGGRLAHHLGGCAGTKPKERPVQFVKKDHGSPHFPTQIFQLISSNDSIRGAFYALISASDHVVRGIEQKETDFDPTLLNNCRAPSQSSEPAGS